MLLDVVVLHFDGSAKQFERSQSKKLYSRFLRSGDPLLFLTQSKHGILL